VYTALAAARSDTGCSTVLIPSVEDPVMFTPDVVGLVWIADGRHASCGLIGRASPFLPSLATGLEDARPALLSRGPRASEAQEHGVEPDQAQCPAVKLPHLAEHVGLLYPLDDQPVVDPDMVEEAGLE
jgi:hypothetical protein